LISEVLSTAEVGLRKEADKACVKMLS